MRAWAASLALTLQILPLLAVITPVSAGEAEDRQGNLSLPSQIELARLVELVGESVGVSIHFDPQKIQGTVRLELRQGLNQAQLWSVFNQVLVNRGLTTVVAGSPTVFHVVALNEAESLGLLFTSPADIEAVKPSPGHVTMVQGLTHITPEMATQTLGAALGQKCQIKAIGRESSRVLISGDRERVLAAARLLALVDRAGNQVAFRTYQPRYAGTAKLQQAAGAAWAAAGKVNGRQVGLEIQAMPDGLRLLVVTTSEAMASAIQLIEELDRAEPLLTRTYRSTQFRLDDVAQLLEQVLRPGDEGRLRIVRSPMTAGLLVTATESQHERVQRLLADLDASPAGMRQSLRVFTIRNRPVADVVIVLRELAGNGIAEAASAAGESQAGAPAQAAQAAQEAPAPAAPAAQSAPRPAANPSPAATGKGGQKAGDSFFTVDAHTNSVIVLGTPRFLDQVAGVIERLDRRQPQVALEITLVTMSDSDALAFSVEWAALYKTHSGYGAVSQLFGQSKQGDSAADRVPGSASGLNALVINPRDWSALLNALQTVNKGRNTVTSRSMAESNVEVVVNAVLQEPVSNINSNSNISTTTFGGTSDAGTQIKIKPLIGAADQVQLTYAISQSAFVGESIKTENGGVIPPPKRQDSLSGGVTVPDGHVIALGGLSSVKVSEGGSGLPWISRIPLLGWLFSNRRNEDSSSRYYVFLRADVMRHPSFEDLKYRSGRVAAEAGAQLEGEPRPAPQFME